MPTLREFIQAAQNHGLSLRTYEAIGPRGRAEVRVLVRQVDERTVLTATLPDRSLENERLRPSVVRSLCRQLAIDVVEFGLVRDAPS
jgi:hypothetical protein